MDGTRFDQLTRFLDRAVSRRTGLRGAVAGLLGGLVGTSPAPEAASKRRRSNGQKLAAQGPCGDGGVKANTCKRHNQCCTGYCNRKRQRCRCRRQGQSCIQPRNCCSRGGQQLTCFQRTCRPRCGAGGPCRVFVTSRTDLTGDLDGLDGADTICQDLAEDAGLPGTYLAWLSDGLGGSPETRFMRSTGPYVLVDGTVIAANWTDLTTQKPDGSYLAAPIAVTEGRATVADRVWTGTDPNGTAPLEEGFHCDNWMDGTSDSIGLRGRSDEKSSGWSRFGIETCDLQYRLYCFQQS